MLKAKAFTGCLHRQSRWFPYPIKKSLLTGNGQEGFQPVKKFFDKLKWLPSSGSHFSYLPDHTGAQESWSTPLRYSLGDTPITSRKARANLLALS